jgi:hypothetical protein
MIFKKKKKTDREKMIGLLESMASFCRPKYFSRFVGMRRNIDNFETIKKFINQFADLEKERFGLNDLSLFLDKIKKHFK